MEEKINIAAILKDKSNGLRLYSPIFGECTFCCVREDTNDICVKKHNGVEEFFDSKGLYYNTGEVMLFPSKEMRDWSKFFKKGDVLLYFDGKCKIIFDKFDDDKYTSFIGKHYLESYGKDGEQQDYEEIHCGSTVKYTKESEEAAQTYINTIEERLGGKLNLETLEIEKKPAFEIGKLYVFDEEDEDGNITVIGKLIGKDESNGTLTFGTQYEIETENFVTDQTFDLNTSIHKELREATENEEELFSKHYSIWQENEKKAKSKCSFKPFDKVLVRSGREFNWYPALFVRERGENRCIALPIHIGKAAEFSSCIPFEGNEHLAFTDEDFVELPF